MEAMLPFECSAGQVEMTWACVPERMVHTSRIGAHRRGDLEANLDDPPSRWRS